MKMVHYQLKKADYAFDHHSDNSYIGPVLNCVHINNTIKKYDINYSYVAKCPNKFTINLIPIVSC